MDTFFNRAALHKSTSKQTHRHNAHALITPTIVNLYIKRVGNIKLLIETGYKRCFQITKHDFTQVFKCAQWA